MIFPYNSVMGYEHNFVLSAFITVQIGRSVADQPFLACFGSSQYSLTDFCKILLLSTMPKITVNVAYV
jgi:hypothetical protein